MGDLFNASPFEWMEKVLLPKLKAKGITSDAKILEEFSTIMTNGNGANLFATMYMQREQIHKNEKLNRGAYGIDQLHALGQKQTEGRADCAGEGAQSAHRHRRAGIARVQPRARADDQCSSGCSASRSSIRRSRARGDRRGRLGVLLACSAR
ncbi:hypothetical protein [Burkholderia multivorans]|uniref:hypothetical protein n=1 Tax=Burkholderia multivorans TaxID=87883 RepID=UPI002016978B|nr:hypothetical protein [Burkholderia multivorans]